MTERVSKNIFWLTFSRAIALGLLFLAYTQLFRYLGPFGSGQYQFVLSYVLIFSTIVDFGVQQFITKRMAEELTKYLSRIQIRCRYIHSDVDTLERVEIMRDLRLGIFDVLIGVNLLREGLDLPEVSLVAILDADKEGFLRSHRSLTQTIGRAARNINGIAIMYADKMTKSMQLTIDETNRRREKQIAYNTENKITPTQIIKSIENIMGQNTASTYNFENLANIAAEEKMDYMTKAELENSIREKRKLMEEAAKALDFIAAAKLRDTIKKLKERV